MAKKTRVRTQRRDTQRVLSKLQSAREKLFQLEPGGSPERALEVSSPAIVEPHAQSVPCPHCDGKHDVVEHVALTRDEVRLREVRLNCRQCGGLRSLWFRIRPEVWGAALN
ncbi:MAG TPA: hypothetical protein VJN18_31980 [Polyangiaceae bacterium]|nr:hypothetical protein [Polyangiaceae bacterium]